MTDEINMPPLRFPDYKEEWKPTILSNFAPLQRGFDLPVADIIVGQYPVVFSNGILKHHSQFKVKAPGVVTGRSGTLGKLTFVDVDFWPHNTSLWVTNFFGNVPKFVYYFYDWFDLKRFGTGSGVPTLNRNDVHSQKILVPSDCEQQKIASFLTAVDDKIQQLSKKKALLELYKKGVMQQLFSQKLRFKDDKGIDFPDWEDFILGDVTQKISRKNKGMVEAELFSVTNSSGFVRQAEHFDRLQSSGDYSTYRIIKRGEFAYNPARINVGSIAHFKHDIGLISSLYVCFNTDDRLEDRFLNYMFDLESFKNQVISFGEGGVRIYLWYDLFAKIRVQLPSQLEQIKIANFLTVLNDKIKGVTQQIEQTQQFKKGLLQQMFV